MNVITPTNSTTVTYSDPVPVKCRACRDTGRASMFVELRREHWADGADPATWGSFGIDGLFNPHIYPTVTFKCDHTRCTHMPRIKQTELRDRYDKAVAKRLGVIYL